jgi:hypothetical protein
LNLHLDGQTDLVWVGGWQLDIKMDE